MQNNVGPEPGIILMHLTSKRVSRSKLQNKTFVLPIALKGSGYIHEVLKKTFNTNIIYSEVI